MIERRSSQLGRTWRPKRVLVGVNRACGSCHVKIVRLFYSDYDRRCNHLIEKTPSFFKKRVATTSGCNQNRINWQLWRILDWLLSAGPAGWYTLSAVKDSSWPVNPDFVLMLIVLPVVIPFIFRTERRFHDSDVKKHWNRRRNISPAAILIINTSRKRQPRQKIIAEDNPNHQYFYMASKIYLKVKIVFQQETLYPLGSYQSWEVLVYFWDIS